MPPAAATLALAGLAGSAFVSKALDERYFIVKDATNMAKLGLMALLIERNVRRKWTAADMLQVVKQRAYRSPACCITRASRKPCVRR